MARDYNHLKQWMLPLIRKRRMSIERFAHRADISRSQLYRYFDDLSRPSEEAITRICHTLRVPVEEGMRQYVPRKRGRPKGSGGGGPSEVRVRQRK